MIFIDNKYQQNWEKVILDKFKTFPVNGDNTGILSIDEAIGFVEEQRFGIDRYAQFRINKFQQMLGIVPSGGTILVRSHEMMSFLLLKYGVINIAPENRYAYWETPEGRDVLSEITIDLLNNTDFGL